MLTYLIRRLLLIPLTLIGMTAVVFTVVANAPGGIGATLVSRTGEMRPEQRKLREDYLNQRYGLNKPKYVQYLRWLNKISPIGFATWEPGAAEVIKAEEEQKIARAPLNQQLSQKRAELQALDISNPANLTQKDAIEAEIRRLDAQVKKIDIGPDPGQIRLSRPIVKMPNLGESFFRGRQNSSLILEALPRTLTLQAIALPFSYALAIWLGIQQAVRRGTTFDFTASASTLGLWCIPVIWMGVLLIGFLANDEYLHLFPANGLSSLQASSQPFLPRFGPDGFEPGWLLDRMHHMVLPLFCLVYTQFAVLSRLARGALLDSLSADYVRTARAKGLSERVVLYRHAFRTSLIPLITVAAYLLPAMITGSVVVETIFGINGMGKLAVDAAFQRDFELLLSITTVVGLLQLVGYLLTDIGYAIADPRVSYA